jgi:hypothetical protein
LHAQPVAAPTHEHDVQPPKKTQLYDVGDPAGPPVKVEQYCWSVHVAVPHGNVLPL